MKKAISILFAALILFCSMNNGIAFTFFKINQSQIAELHCINKDQPDLHCDGKCFFKKQFEERNDDQSPYAPWSNLEKAVKIDLIHSDFSTKNNEINLLNITPNFRFTHFSFQHYTSPFLRPPIQLS
ncbi:MAG: hypothetical protein R2825_13540 [Saprospiraceae bacterium]